MASRPRYLGWAFALAILPGCSLAPKSFKGIKNPAPLFRARAIPLGRGLPDRVVIPSLLRSLDDKDQVVRLAAFSELKKRTGQDFGYVPYAEPAERAAAVARWNAWWQAQGRDDEVTRTGLAGSRRLR